MSRERSCKLRDLIIIKDFLNLLNENEKNSCALCSPMPNNWVGFCDKNKFLFETKYRQCVFIGKFSQLKKD